jgi:hypothetical protein
MTGQELIVAQLITNNDKKEYTRGKANREAENIQESEGLMPYYIPNGNFKIILDHGYTLQISRT